MSLKTKLTFFIVAFLCLVALFIGGSFMVFDHMSKNYETLRASTERHNMYEGLKLSIRDFLKTTKGWAITGDTKYKRQYHERLADVYKSFGNVTAIKADTEVVQAVGKDFEELKKSTRDILAIDYPVGNINVIFGLRKIEVREEAILSKLDELEVSSMKFIHTTIEQGERIKSEMAWYLVALFALSSLAFLFLAFFMRRMIAVPVKDILTATDRIISGDIDYRIASRRKDEFGIIAQRFDFMVGELQSISAKNEDLYLSTKNQLGKLRTLYELAKAITSTLDLDEVLKMVSREATWLLNAKGCIIRLLEDDNLVVKSSYGLPEEMEQKITLSLGEGLPGKVAKEGRPILVDDLSSMSPEWKVPYLEVTSALTVPLTVGDKVIGTMGFYDKMAEGGRIISFSGEDLNTAEGFASLSAIAIEKAKMFETELLRELEALDAKKRMDVLFESVQGGVMTLGKNYTILSANRHVETWIGRSVDEIIGKSCIEIFHGDKGICPHCVAQLTCETGQINTITQMNGLNYAELTSYPVRDEGGAINECVVFIQDITDRVLYQEEMLALYREVTQTKEYLESLVDNSADAIVTSDLQGIVTSWNQGAEKIYGYAEEEVIGKFLPFIPEELLGGEREYTQRVGNGEVLKDIETVRRRKDGTVIEVSLTLSPVKDASGAIIGVCGISRDISEKKKVEKELIKRNNELSRLFFISSAMRSTLDLDRLLRMILTAVTMGDGLGFNRAVLFLVDEKRNILKGAMGVGPSSYDEAGRVWGNLSMEGKTLDTVMQEIDSGRGTADGFIDRLSRGIEIPLGSDSLFAVAVKEKKPLNIPDARSEALADTVLIQQFGTEAYAIVPLISRDRVIGVLWVDNFFNKKPITNEDMKFLTAFSNQVATAIESAKLFEQVSFAEAELENIFKSITDMVYFTDIDYTIKSINKAVSEKLNLPEEEIVGRKCYEVFHGTHEPRKDCPHHKTVEQRIAFVEEFKEPGLGETFLTSTSPLFDKAGLFLGTVHIVREITELIRIREKLASTERMAALGEVAAKVAHEIRNPLVSVGGFAQRLEKKLDGSLKEYAAIIVNEVTRLESILKDILGFVKEIRLALKQVNMNDLIRNILSLTGSEMSGRKIILETSLGDIPEVMVDPDRIKEALLNIMNNAIQAVTTHGKITVVTYPHNGYVVIEIRDTGTGIEERDMPFIFDPFYTTKAAGTGLGLAITRRIVEEHKGRIEAKSRPGEGTIVKVFLPRGKEER